VLGAGAQKFRQVHESLPDEDTKVYQVLQQMEDRQEFVCWCVFVVDCFHENLPSYLIRLSNGRYMSMLLNFQKSPETSDQDMSPWLFDRYGTIPGSLCIALARINRSNWKGMARHL
jgi:hypothetical protein